VTHLTRLVLGGNRLGDEGVRVLAASPRLGRLTSLELTGTGIGAEGARLLESSAHLRRLTSLDLGFNSIDDEQVQARLRQRFGEDGVVY
jgi:hypothetical protein